MPNKRHKALVQAMKERVGGQCTNFGRTVLKMMDVDRSEYDQAALRYRREARRLDGGMSVPRGITPDVFLVKSDAEEVICYEIEETSAIDEGRLARYVEWFWFMDDHGWILRLFIVRAYSLHGVAAELSLFGISTTWDSDSAVHIVGQLGTEPTRNEPTGLQESQSTTHA